MEKKLFVYSLVLDDDNRVRFAWADGRYYFPYIRSKHGGWDLDQSLSYDAVRARLKRGTLIFR